MKNANTLDQTILVFFPMVWISLARYVLRDFQIHFSFQHAEFFSQLFRRSDSKDLFEFRRNDTLVSPNECDLIIQKRVLPPRFSEVHAAHFFMQISRIHVRLTCVTIKELHQAQQPRSLHLSA